MSQNRVVGWNLVTAVAATGESPFQVFYTMDEIAVQTPGSGGYTVTLDPAPQDGDRVKIKDISGTASSGNAISIVSPTPASYPILSSGSGSVTTLQIKTAFGETQLTFSSGVGAWLSSL